MIYRFKRLVAITFMLVASASTFAQGAPTVQDLRKATDVAMEMVGKGDIEGGLKSFQSLVAVPKSEFDSMLGQAALYAPTMSARFGGTRGYEFVEEKWVGKSLVRLTYIHKYDVHATRWMFYCYLGKNGWTINTFRFDDKTHELF
jgi:hypothetical protein